MNAYFERTILDADPIELVRIVYQRAIACVKDARECLRTGRIRERGTAVNRAYAALHELRNALSHEAAPELAGRLEALYLYMQGRLLEANGQQTDAPLAEVLSLLTTLSGAWAVVDREMNDSIAMTA